MNLTTLPNKREVYERLKREDPDFIKILELITEYFGKPERVTIKEK